MMTGREKTSKIVNSLLNVNVRPVYEFARRKDGLNLKGTELIVYCYLFGENARTGGRCYLKPRQLAEVLGCTEPSVRKVLSRMTEKGLIEVIGSREQGSLGYLCNTAKVEETKFYRDKHGSWGLYFV